ncbi:CHAP domain-containing protein [Candidatus Saccharibacteria bacterium]|nr:CHAP domain-containing protein [Candidatus Saccharibacteria bacterium]
MANWHKTKTLILVAAVLLASSVTLPVSAYTQEDLNKINAKISALRGEIANYEQKAAELSKQADNISNAIAMLQNEQANLRTQIELKEAEHEQIVADIDTVSTRIEKNSTTIGLIIEQYYFNSRVSTVERLASSENFASFVDTEVNLGGISDTLSGIVEENRNLKAELEVKRHDAELILEDLDNQKNQLAAKEVEQANLLAQTKLSEASYQALKRETNSQKSALEEEQQKILQDLYSRYNASGITAGDPSKGGYPYSGYCPQQKDAFADRWGMYICECVSYTAWRVYNAYGYMPNWAGRGNANQWIANARQAGYTVSNTPKPGAVGISMAGRWGHAVWVEAVSGNRVYISQYNARNAATGYVAGQYSEQWVDQGMYQYIYFR